MRALLVLAAALAAVAAAGEITSMPGLAEALPGKLYSGYFTVDAVNNRRLFYMFMESATDPVDADVAVWFTGGPGCSSMLGFFTESGPFRPQPGGKLALNPHSWVYANASFLAIESPAGVGFSSSNVTSDYTTGDKRTADDAYNAIQAFYKEFPQLLKNKLWVTGESYGGHYVPEFSQRVLNGNAALRPGDAHVNIAGWMVGDPWTDPPVEAPLIIRNWYDRGVISQKNYAAIQELCSWEAITFWIVNNVTVGNHRSPQDMAIVWGRSLEEATRKGLLGPGTPACFKQLEQTSKIAYDFINVLDMEADVCSPGTVAYPHAPNPCGDNQLTEYMNLPAVRAALGVTDPVPGGSWAPCSAQVHYSTADTQTSVVDIYRNVLVNTTLKVLVYSGTSDLIIPTVTTREWTQNLARDMNFATVNPHHPWFSDSNGKQLAGWATQYSRFTFTSIRGAGHEVPLSQPERAFAMFKSFKDTGSL